MDLEGGILFQKQTLRADPSIPSFSVGKGGFVPVVAEGRKVQMKPATCILMFNL